MPIISHLWSIHRSKSIYSTRLFNTIWIAIFVVVKIRCISLLQHVLNLSNMHLKNVEVFLLSPFITISKSYVSPLFISLQINGWHPPAGGCQKFSASFACHLAGSDPNSETAHDSNTTNVLAEIHSTTFYLHP